MDSEHYAGDLTPAEAWRLLTADSSSVLIDVRTPAEWTYVGVPDVSSLGKTIIFIPWVNFPTMDINSEFAQQMIQKDIQAADSLLFICRSGVRSKAAAIEMTVNGFENCFNIKDGFEGDLDVHRHRSCIAGWKNSGLPWVQS
jgi:rhodanese-related sulfurtransferase